MGSRKKRRVIKIIKKSLPKVFLCPNCGMSSIRIKLQLDDFIVTCGSCDLTPSDRWLLDKKLNLKKKEPVDIFNEFVDDYMSGGL